MVWGHTRGHRWSYDDPEALGGMVVHFEQRAGSTEPSSCCCRCGVCSPGAPHRAEDGCACRLLGCPCLSAPDN